MRSIRVEYRHQACHERAWLQIGIRPEWHAHEEGTVCQREGHHGARKEHIQKSARESEGVSEKSEEGVRARCPSFVQLLPGLHQHQDYVFQFGIRKIAQSCCDHEERRRRAEQCQFRVRQEVPGRNR